MNNGVDSKPVPILSTRRVKVAFFSLLLGWLLMVVVHTVLFRVSRTYIADARVQEVITGHNGVTERLVAPVKVNVLGEDILELGESEYVLFTDPEGQRFLPGWDMFRIGFPLQSFDFRYKLGLNADGGSVVHTSGALYVQGAHIPLVPNGLNFFIPYGGLRANPLLYILNTAIWGIAVYVLFVVNTRMRIQIHADRKRKKMKKQGRCVNCGYSIGSLPQCPECGTNQTHRKTKHIIPDG